MDKVSVESTSEKRTIFEQIVISCFTGFIGGLYGYENNKSIYIILIIVGVSSTLGSSLIRWLWSQIIKNIK
ncbi:phage holin family protein [Yokenella regensburgei]|uniref:phage holin family protein n=1 Tax=Yokenella regensburgei TaxID=158877 RepID=UPI003CC90CC5